MARSGGGKPGRSMPSPLLRALRRVATGGRSGRSMPSPLLSALRRVATGKCEANGREAWPVEKALMDLVESDPEKFLKMLEKAEALFTVKKIVHVHELPAGQDAAEGNSLCFENG